MWLKPPEVEIIFILSTKADGNGCNKPLSILILKCSDSSINTLRIESFPSAIICLICVTCVLIFCILHYSHRLLSIGINEFKTGSKRFQNEFKTNSKRIQNEFKTIQNDFKTNSKRFQNGSKRVQVGVGHLFRVIRWSFSSKASL